MFQSPVLQLALGRELDRAKLAAAEAQIDPQPVESVLDSIVRRLRQLIGTKPMQPLARGAS